MVEKIKNCEDADPFDDDLSFYKTHFSPKTKITVLGYSLGGLMAFGSFLINNDKIDKLILFNTPGSLQDASTRTIGVSTKKWEKVFERFSDNDGELRKILREKGHDEDYVNNFIDLMIHRKNGNIKKAIDLSKQRILQIMCGGDKVIDMKPWGLYFDQETEDKRLIHKKISQHIFSGVGHYPILESRGSEIMPNISRIMIDHILNDESTSHWQENEIEEALMTLIRSTKSYESLKRDLDDPDFNKTFTSDQLKKLLINEFKNDITSKERFLKFYYLSKMYFPKFYDLIEKNKKRDDRHKRIS